MQTDPIQIMLEVIDKNLADIDKAAQGLGNLDKTQKTATDSNKSMQSELEGSVTKYFSYAAAVALTEKAIDSAIEAWHAEVDAAAEVETALSQLNATIQSTGRSGEISTAQVKTMAAGMSGLFDTAQIVEATNALVRFTDIPTEQIPGDLKVIENMAAALGETLPQAAQAFGMAMETGRTRGMGFSRELTNEISALMTAGKIQEADALILDNLSKKYSGQATAALKTYNGGQQELKASTTELNAVIGSVWLPLMEQVDNVTTGVVNEIIKYTEWLYHLKPAVDDTAISTKNLGDDTAYYADQTDNAAMATARGTDKTTHYVEAVEDLSTKMSAVISYNDIYSQGTKDIAAAEADLAAIRKAGWGEHSKAVQDAKQKIKDLQDAEDAQTQKWIDDQLLQRLSVNGLSKTEFEFYQAYLVHTGQETAAQEANALAAWNTVDALAAMVDKTVTISINYVSSGGADVNGPGDGVVKHTPGSQKTAGYWDGGHPPKWVKPTYYDKNGMALGGDFTVPSGYDNDSYPIQVQSGEHVKVTPAGHSDSGGVSIVQNFYGPTSPEAVRAASQDGIMEAMRARGA